MICHVPNILYYGYKLYFGGAVGGRDDRLN